MMEHAKNKFGNTARLTAVSYLLPFFATRFRGSSTHKTVRTILKTLCRTKTWASTHVSFFDIRQYQLIHFRLTPFIGPEVSMRLDGHFVSVPSSVFRFLFHLETSFASPRNQKTSEATHSISNGTIHFEGHYQGFTPYCIAVVFL